MEPESEPTKSQSINTEPENEGFFDKYNIDYETIIRKTIYYLRYKGVENAEDLVHEIFLRLLQQKEKLNSIEQIENYIFISARNLAREFSRKSLREKQLTEDNFVVQLTFDESPDERLSCLENCLSRLSSKEANLILSYYKEVKGEEKIKQRNILSEQLGISIGTLHVRVHRLKTALRKCIEKCMEAHKK